MSTAQAPHLSGRSVFKGAIKGTAIYSIPLIGQRVASIILLSIVTRVLTREDFGMVSLLEQVSAVLGILFCGTLSSSLGYFNNLAATEKERGEAAGTAIGGALLLGSAAAVVCWPAQRILAQRVFLSQDALRYLPVVLLCMPATFVLEALTVKIRVTEETRSVV